MIKPFMKAVIAGWSSQVARRAHNPKVARFESRPRNQNPRGNPSSVRNGEMQARQGARGFPTGSIQRRM